MRIAAASRRVAIAILLPCACLAGAACGGASDPGQVEVAGNAVPVTVAIARIETLRDVIAVPGTVVPAAAFDWTIHAPEPGLVAELPVATGDAVTAGELLVRFDVLSVTQQIATRQALLAAAERALADAQAEFTRKEALFERGLVARNDYEATRAAAAAAQSQVSQARTELEIVEQLVDTTRVTARFDGLVAEVWKAEGDFAEGGESDPVLRVVDPTRTEILIDVPVEQTARLSVNQPAVVLSPLAEGPVEATVARLETPDDPGAANVPVRLAYRREEPLEIGSPVQAEIVLEQRVDAVVVPADAVLRDDAGAFVLIAGADLVAHRRDVRVGLVLDALAQITQGLAAGDRVIVGGASQVADGQAILVGR